LIISNNLAPIKSVVCKWMVPEPKILIANLNDNIFSKIDTCKIYIYIVVSKSEK